MPSLIARGNPRVMFGVRGSVAMGGHCGGFRLTGHQENWPKKLFGLHLAQPLSRTSKWVRPARPPKTPPTEILISAPSPTRRSCLSMCVGAPTASCRWSVSRQVLEWPYTVGGQGAAPPPPPTNQRDHRGKKRNHLEERLLDQAQARASYTPLFGGRSRSAPQGMVSDVLAPKMIPQCFFGF